MYEPHYSLRHRLYLRLFGYPFTWAKGELVLKSVSPAGGGRILDLGCRGGLYVAEFAVRGASAVGIDIEQEIVGKEVPAWIKDKFNPGFIVADARYLPIRDNVFDRVTILDCLEHIREDELVLSESYRVLRPGGKLILCVPTIPGYPPHRVLSRFISLLPDRLLLRGEAKGEGHVMSMDSKQSGICLAKADQHQILEAFGHVRHYDEDLLRAKLSQSGFQKMVFRRFQKLFESEMITFHFGVKGFQHPFVYPFMRLVALLDTFLPKDYPGVGLLCVAEK